MFWANPTSMNGNEEQEVESPSLLPPGSSNAALLPPSQPQFRWIDLATTAYEQPVVR